MEKKISVGLIGFGTIGRGVVRWMLENGNTLMARKGFEMVLVKVADLDIQTSRGIELPQEMLTTDAEEVLEHKDMDIVIELIGGLEPARTFILKALRRGKSVVTANKALLSRHGDELFRTAYENGVDVSFEASVGGGIPIIRVLRESLFTNRADSLYGILNGTTNYILTRMADEGRPFGEILRQAQDAGYAEPDPTLDIRGQDAVQKLTILLRMAFGSVFSSDQIFCEGIEYIMPQDIEYARELGYTIKLLAIAKRSKDRIEARVHPVMIPEGTLLASIKDEFNAIELVGDWVGPQVFYGKGAGERPTTNAVVSDVVELAERRLSGAPSRAGELLTWNGGPSLIPMEEVCIPYYFRFLVADKPGVLAQISRILAEEQISIASVIQKGRAQHEGTVPLIIMTHEAKEKAVRSAIQRINTLDIVRDRVQVIRVEELGG